MSWGNKLFADVEGRIKKALKEHRQDITRITGVLPPNNIPVPTTTTRGGVAFATATPAAGTNAGAVGAATAVNRSDHSHPTGITLREADSAPAISNLVTIIVPNGSLTDNGGGSGTLAFAPGAIDVLTTRGDLLTRDASAYVRLPLGASGRYLRSDGTDPNWSPLGFSDLAYTGLTTGQVLRATGASSAAFGALDLANTSAVTGLLAPANGGTGVDNATRTLTIATNGGTLAFSSASLTLTIPATGTAALLEAANVFTALQTADAKLAVGATGDAALTVTTVEATASGVLSSLLMRVNPASGAAQGAAIHTQLKSSTTDNQDAGKIEVFWTTSVHALRTSAMTFSATSAGTFSEKMRLIGAGALWIGLTSSGLTGVGDLEIAGQFKAGNAAIIAGGSTFTIPATGTAALLEAANVFTAAQSVTVDNATANSTTVVLNLTHTTTGTAANNIGTGVAVFAETDGGATRQICAINFTFPTAADATRKGRARFFIYDTAARAVMDMEANGSAAMIGFLGAAAVVRQSVAAAAPAGGTGATAGAYDTAAHRDALITLVNDMRTAGINLGLWS